LGQAVKDHSAEHRRDDKDIGWLPEAQRSQRRPRATASRAPTDDE